MEHSKTNKPVLTALDILQFRNLQKQLLPPRNQLAPYQLSYVVAIDDSDSKFFHMLMQEKRCHITLQRCSSPYSFSPKHKSPASPKPGTIYLCSFIPGSMAAHQMVVSASGNVFFTCSTPSGVAMTHAT